MFVQCHWENLHFQERNHVWCSRYKSHAKFTNFHPQHKKYVFHPWNNYHVDRVTDDTVTVVTSLTTVTVSASVTVSATATVTSEPVGEVSGSRCECDGDELSIRWTFVLYPQAHMHWSRVTTCYVAPVSVTVPVMSESVGKVSGGRCECDGDEVSIKHRAISSSSHAPESCDNLRRGTDVSGVVISRIVSTWTSGVVGALHVNDAALDGVALVSQTDTSASCGDIIGARDESLSACDNES